MNQHIYYFINKISKYCFVFFVFSIFFLSQNAMSAVGRVDVNGGVSISPTTVTVGQNFTVSFNLKEFQNGTKTFEYVELWIQDGSGADIYMAQHWDNISFSANQQRSFSSTTFLDPARGRGAGNYRAIVRGKLANDVPFNFGIVSGSGASNPGYFSAILPGRVDVSGGLSISPTTVTVGQNFAVSFNLKEFQGGFKSFEYVELWIQNSSGGDLYMAQRWDNVSFSPNQQQSFSVTTYLDPAQGRGAGSYRAIARGKVAGDVPFNFGVVSGSGAVNPGVFNAALPPGRVDVSGGVSILPTTVTIGQNFNVSFNLKEYQGGNKTFEYVELWIQNGSGSDLYMAQRWNAISFSPNQQQSFTATTNLDPAQGRGVGSYRAIVRGKVAGDVPFNFGIVSGSGASNPGYFSAILPGRVDVSGGVSVSPTTVMVGQNFTVSFNLKEFQGGFKSFEYIELWIQNSSGGDLYMAQHWDNVSFSPNQQQSFSVTTYLDPTQGRGAGSYRAIARGKVVGDAPFNFGIVSGSGAVNPGVFNAALPPGRVDVGGGVSISPMTVTVGQNYSVSFNLKEFQGGNKTFEYVELWIQNGSGGDLFMAQRWNAVSFSPNQQQSFIATTNLDPAQGRGAGSYRAIVRGKVAGDMPFNFGVVTGSGASNPGYFSAILPGRVDVNGGVSLSPTTIGLGQDFTVSFNLKEFQGNVKSFEYIDLWIQNSGGRDLYLARRWDNVSFTANQQLSFSTSTYLDPAQGRTIGTYQAIVRGKVAGELPFNFSIVSGSGAVNPKVFNVGVDSTITPSSVVVDPSLGNWTATPQNLNVSSSNSTTIYWKMVNTYDGSTSADPEIPSPTKFDGTITGPNGVFMLFANSGQNKKIKLRFIGCNSKGCGPVSSVYFYSFTILSSDKPTQPSPYSEGKCPINLSGRKNGLVFITHGWIGKATDNSKDWVNIMATKIKAITDTNQNIQWCVVPYDWSALALTLVPWDAYSNAEMVGKGVLGEYFIAGRQQYDQQYDYVHLIAHSVGSKLIDTVATELTKFIDSYNKNHTTGLWKKPIIHTTFLDAYDIAGTVSRYGYSSDYAEQYVDSRLVALGDPIGGLGDLTRIRLPGSYNIDVTNLDPDINLPIIGINAHAWPYKWYQKTIDNLDFSNYGFNLTFEMNKPPSYERTGKYGNG